METDSLLIDFTELATPSRGEGLEHLVREIGKRKGLSPTWTGRGADAGRDLFFTEFLSGSLSKQKVTWLVSCKDKAGSNASVTEKDLPHSGIKDKLAQHKAHGFLLATTTTVSTAAKELLDSLDISQGGSIRTLVWDSAELTAILLEPSNQDLLKQFLPQSYRRVKGMTTLEGAILSFRNELPTDILIEVLKLVRPYSSATLEGTVIWPFDATGAAQIDRILEFILKSPDLDRAVQATQKIQLDVFIVLLQYLHVHYLDECLPYLSAIIKKIRNKTIKFNAAQFLFENYELTRAQVIEFATHLGRESFEELYSSEVSDFIETELIFNAIEYGLHSSLDEMSSHTRIEDIRASPEFDPVRDKKVGFTASLLVTVELEYDGEEMGSYLLPGKCSGYFDESGIYLQEATVDTRAYYA